MKPYLVEILQPNGPDDKGDWEIVGDFDTEDEAINYVKTIQGYFRVTYCKNWERILEPSKVVEEIINEYEETNDL